MECAKQGYWSWEYHESKGNYTGSQHNGYTRFAKRQYHKARRRHDEEVIEEQLSHFDYRFLEGYRPDLYIPCPDYSDISLLDEWQEHNHKTQIKEVL